MASLTTYLSTRGESQTAFARRAGLTDATLSRLLTGKTAPSADVVEKVHAATRGEVTANDLYETWREARRDEPRPTAAASEDRP